MPTSAPPPLKIKNRKPPGPPAAAASPAAAERPRRAPRVLKAARGGKRRKAGAGYTDLNRPRLLRDAPKGDYISPRLDYCSIDRDPDAKPLNAHARALLVDYLRRQAFWDAIEDDKVPLDMAGETYLQVGERRAYTVHRELKEAHGPWRWFRRRVVDALNSQKIGRGSATAADAYGDRFYSALAGGLWEVENLTKAALGGGSEVRESEAFAGRTDLEKEIISYFVQKHLPVPKRKGAARG